MKFLKEIFIILFRLTYIALAFVFLGLWIITRPNILSAPAERIINELLEDDIHLESLQYASLSLGQDALILKNPQFTLHQEGQAYAVSFENIIILKELIRDEDCLIGVNGGSMKNDAIQASGIYGQFAINGRVARSPVQGLMAIGPIQYNQYRIKGAAAHLKANEYAVDIGHLVAWAYGGQITGEARIQFDPEEAVTASLNVAGIDTAKIPTVQGQLKGVISAQIQYAGTFDTIESLTADFSSPGSEMEKTLLKYLMGNINDSLAYLPFAEALDRADFIHLDNFEGRLHNVGQDSLGIEMSLDSNQLNLNLNPSITINLR